MAQNENCGSGSKQQQKPPMTGSFLWKRHCSFSSWKHSPHDLRPARPYHRCDSEGTEQLHMPEARLQGVEGGMRGRSILNPHSDSKASVLTPSALLPLLLFYAVAENSKPAHTHWEGWWDRIRNHPSWFNSEVPHRERLQKTSSLRGSNK